MYLKLALLVCVLTIAGCKSDEPDNVLAQIGDEVITADEFRLNYEFGHGHLRTGNSPKKNYLQYLIYESAFAQEAKKQNFDTVEAIEHALRQLNEELLIERVFEEKVLAGIEVSEEEVRAEINRDAVTFQFRLLPAGSETEARKLYDAVQATSFEEVMEEQLENSPELRMVEGELTSPFVGPDELDPEILAIIKDLEINKPSTPQFYRGAWYLFEVMDIRRLRLAEDDYKLKSPTYEKIIFNRKAMEEGAGFVAQTMQPLDVKTKREGFEILQAALFDWYSDEIPKRNLLHYINEKNLDTPYTKQLVDNYEVPLVTYRDASWDIEDFLTHFTPGRYVVRPEDPQTFKARVADIVALVIRDHVLLEMAEDENLGESPEFQRTRALWMNKWRFQEYRNRWVADESSPTRAAWLTHAESLLKNYDVKVNWKMLDTLTTNVSRINPTMTVHLFKNNANKMPFPIADPNWKSGADFGTESGVRSTE